MGQHHNAFSRSKAMLAAILQIMAFGGSPLAQKLQLEALGQYKSRGHGGKFGRRGSRPNFDSGSSNNIPHQGVQECARRVNKYSWDRQASPVKRMWNVSYFDGAGNLMYKMVKVFSRRSDAVRAARKYDDLNTPTILLV